MPESTPSTLYNIHILPLHHSPLSLATYPLMRIATNWTVGSTRIARQLYHLLPRAALWAMAGSMATPKVSAVATAMAHQVVVRTAAVIPPLRTVGTATAPRRAGDLHGLETETIHPLIPACRPGRHHQRMAIPAIAIESTVIGRLVLLTDEALQSADQMSTRIFPATEWEEEMRGHPETTVLREMIDDDGTTTMIDGRQIGTVSETA